jgi:energy-coupling factor transport system permease protein
MHPRALAAWSGSCLVFALGTTNPAYRALALIAALAVGFAIARSRDALRRLLIGLALLTLATGFLNTLVAHVGGDILVEVPAWVPGIGGPLTLEGLVAGLAAGLGLAAAIAAVAPLSLGSQAHELVDALPAALNRTGSALAASFNLVPAVARSFTAVHEAQLMRGWRARGPRSWGEIVVPVVLTAIEDSIQLAESMEARAFGSGARSHFVVRRWRPLDVAVALGAAAAAIVFIAARAAGLASDWEPYPFLTLPAVDPPVATAALLLFLPVASRWL